MSCMHKKVCPVLEAVRDVFAEMVEERPLLWAGISLAVGVFFGRYGFCCPCSKKKHCCHGKGKCH